MVKAFSISIWIFFKFNFIFHISLLPNSDISSHSLSFSPLVYILVRLSFCTICMFFGICCEIVVFVCAIVIMLSSIFAKYLALGLRNNEITNTKLWINSHFHHFASNYGELFHIVILCIHLNLKTLNRIVNANTWLFSIFSWEALSSDVYKTNFTWNSIFAWQHQFESIGPVIFENKAPFIWSLAASPGSYHEHSTPHARCTFAMSRSADSSESNIQHNTRWA